MARRLVFSYAGTVTADGQQEFPQLDLSSSKRLSVEFKLTGNAAAAAGDTLDVYLQSRSDLNAWDDRIRLAQVIGTALSGELQNATLSSAPPLGDTEEVYEPNGSTGGSRLAASTVRNGSFPGLYRASATGQGSTNMPGTAWRFDFDITSVSAPSFPISLKVYAE